MQLTEKSTIRVVLEKGTTTEFSRELFKDVESPDNKWFWDHVDLVYYEEDTGRNRVARRIMNDYAVSELPFVLISHGDGEEYAAVYSEEGPITLERINEKV
jgi:hypothetical protein